MEILKLIEKNLKILFRNKFSAFIVVLGPILIILLAGLAFNNSSEYKFNRKFSTKSTAFSSGFSSVSLNLFNQLSKPLY